MGILESLIICEGILVRKILKPKQGILLLII